VWQLVEGDRAMCSDRHLNMNMLLWVIHGLVTSSWATANAFKYTVARQRQHHELMGHPEAPSPAVALLAGNSATTKEVATPAGSPVIPVPVRPGSGPALPLAAPSVRTHAGSCERPGSSEEAVF
ncbi:MAG: hypothetical protein EBS90_11425, partial [Betaproteobacteria bacterium]|nr:hypothetical protein [Betaproteobacteria bacterium]